MKAFGKKLAVILVLWTMSAAAFATLGDGKLKGGSPSKTLFSAKKVYKPGTFSLRSDYNFRGNQVINPNRANYINLNTVLTYQQGSTTYVVPVQKKVSVQLSRDLTSGNAATATFKVNF